MTLRNASGARVFLNCTFWSRGRHRTSRRLNFDLGVNTGLYSSQIPQHILRRLTYTNPMSMPHEQNTVYKYHDCGYDKHKT